MLKWSLHPSGRTDKNKVTICAVKKTQGNGTETAMLNGEVKEGLTTTFSKKEAFGQNLNE